MDRYLEIRLLPDPEFAPSILLNALFGKLHRALVAHGSNHIGISFPEVTDRPLFLGQRLRLHGSAAELEKLMGLQWLTGMRDHVAVGAISPVPSHARHRTVRRVQAKSSPERLRRRLIARKSISAEDAVQAIPDSAAETLRLPYLTLKSLSTGQQFRLFVEHLPIQDLPVFGHFSAYGLSATATVPWF